MQFLTKKEKEERVIQLLKDGKNYKYIAKEVHVSFTFINLVYKRYFGNDDHSNLRTQAYRMFLEGKRPIDVAITLNIPHDETKKLWVQYLELNKESVLLRIRDELQDNFESFVSLHKEMNSSNWSVDDIGIGLKTAQDIEAQSLYLESLRNKISEAENKNSKLQEDIQGKISVITNLNSQIFAISKLKNSLTLQLRFAQENMRNSFFTNGAFSGIPFQRP